MKKLFLIAIASMTASIAGAQIQFGAKAGLNLSTINVSNSGSTSFKIKPGFHAGGLVYIPLFNNFGLQPEVMYSAEGSKISDGTESGNYNLGYINVPVLFKYKDPSGFFAEIGPQIGVLLSAKVKANGQTVDEKDYIKSTEISGALGIGYLTSLNIGIDARYNLGLTNIAKDSGGETAKNGVIQVGIFYLFGGSKK